MTRLLPLLTLLASTSGCIGHEEEIIPPGEFLVELDPAAGTAYIVPEMGATTAGLVMIPVELDGVPGEGPAETLEATIEYIGRGEANCGRPDGFCVDVMLRSFYSVNSLRNLRVELTRRTPMAGNGILNSDPSIGGEGNYHGLFRYAALDPAGGAVDTSTRRWVIEDNEVAIRFRARVIGTVD